VTTETHTPAAIYWHRQLPPIEAEFVGEHTLEAVSHRVSGNLAHRDEMWQRCHEDLMREANDRLVQEVARLGGNHAHVLHESIDSRHDDAKGEAWLHGVFDYALYR
jgi:hypothetical protein